MSVSRSNIGSQVTKSPGKQETRKDKNTKKYQRKMKYKQKSKKRRGY